MRTRKQVIIEEEYQGMTYLSVKAPLIINNNVEGVIGLAVDITEKKKNEDLALENRLQAIKINEQNRISEIAEYVAHDIRSPLATISAVTATLRDIPENRRVALRTAVMFADGSDYYVFNSSSRRIYLESDAKTRKSF